jgi:type II secretory pathway component PulC
VAVENLAALNETLPIEEIPAEIDRISAMIHSLEAVKNAYEEMLKGWIKENSLDKSELNGYICTIYRQIRKDLDKDELAKVIDLTPYIREKVIEGFKITRKRGAE